MPSSQRPRVAVVLAAGKGTRMRSSIPKVLHCAAGRPLLQWVIDAARGAGCEKILVVVGHGAEQVREEIGAHDIEWVLQAEQLGTGHALAQAEPYVDGEALLLVLSGDVPLVTTRTLSALAADAEAGWGSMAVAELRKPGSLGRVLTKWDGSLDKIVEARDANEAQLAVKLINAGMYALPAPEIFDELRKLDRNNAQGEIYLTDAVGRATLADHPVRLTHLADPEEAFGVNDRRELARVHRVLIDRHLDELMDSGVTILEPDRTTVEPDVRVGRDTVIHPGVSLLGRTEVGAGCTLYQGAWLRDTTLGAGVSVAPYTVLDGAEVAEGEQIGLASPLLQGGG